MLYPSLTIQLITVSIITLQRELIHLRTTNRTEWYDSYNYIVIGSGTAGAVVATRLTEDSNIKVLLVEAGGPQTVISDMPAMVLNLYNPEYCWQYRTVPQTELSQAFVNREISQIRGRVIGGTSTINGMMYNRGNRRDFDSWVNKYGANGWSYDEVLPYFIKSENNSDSQIVSQNPGFHGTRGPIGVSTSQNSDLVLVALQKTMNSLGIRTVDFNGRTQLGTAIIQMTIKQGVRSGSGNAYIDPNPHPNNLHIVTRVFVTKILFSNTSDGITATGVQFVRNNITYNVNATNEVILSAGTISSPQILMLSGIGPKEHLNELGIPLIADLPVGDNYMDHLIVPFYSYITTNMSTYTPPELNIQQLYEYYTNSSGPLSQVPISYTYFSTKNNYDKEWPDTILALSIYPLSNNLTQVVSQYGSHINEWKTFWRPYLGRNIVWSEANLHRSRSRGKLRLSSTNPFDYPIIDPIIHLDPQDLEALIETSKINIFIQQNTTFSQYATLIPTPIPGCEFCPNISLYKCDSYIRCYIRNLGQIDVDSGGTCRMGSVNRTDVVVDERLRVKNIARLRVIDFSIVPHVPNGNPFATTVMIGEYGSHMIQQDAKLIRNLSY